MSTKASHRIDSTNLLVLSMVGTCSQAMLVMPSSCNFGLYVRYNLVNIQGFSDKWKLKMDFPAIHSSVLYIFIEFKLSQILGRDKRRVRNTHPLKVFVLRECKQQSTGHHQ